MNGSAWMNLPSTNLPRAKKFYSDIGFEMNKAYEAPHMVSMFVGENRLIVNLFEEELFKSFTGFPESKNSNMSLISLGAASPEEVDEFARKVVAAGGRLYAEPGYKDGWMYGCGIIDPDGHRWNALYMDMSKMPK